MKWISLTLLGLLLWLGTSYWRTAMALEKPDYTLLSKEGRLEIRKYAALTLASTNLKGSYDSSTSAGFRTIANYIFGNNVKEEKIAMTAPVLVENPAKPSYKMAFVMPSETVESGLPSPSSAAVELQEVSWGRVAVWNFGGWATEERIEREWGKMSKKLKAQGIDASSLDMIAQYNPPFLPPPFRHNEIWVLLDPPLSQ